MHGSEDAIQVGGVMRFVVRVIVHVSCIGFWSCCLISDGATLTGLSNVQL